MKQFREVRIRCTRDNVEADDSYFVLNAVAVVTARTVTTTSVSVSDHDCNNHKPMSVMTKYVCCCNKVFLS